MAALARRTVVTLTVTAETEHVSLRPVLVLKIHVLLIRRQHLPLDGIRLVKWAFFVSR